MGSVTVRLQAMADQAAQQHGLDPSLFRALIQTESSWNPKAVSSAGAQGLGQLMPATAQALGVRQPLDAQQNLDGAARYLRSLLERFGGDESKALAGYNAGPGAVEKYGGVPPFKETQNYVARIQALRGEVGGNQVAPSASTVSLMDTSRDLGWGKSSSAPSSGQNQSAAPVDLSGLQSRTKANLTGLHPELQNALASAAGDLNQQGIDLGSLITSGFRSSVKQAQLYDDYTHGRSPYPAAAPGHSQHEQGGAVDISLRSLPPDQQNAVMSALQAHGLTRPMANDPVHWQLAGANISKGGATAPSGDTVSLSDTARDLGWNKAPAPAPVPGGAPASYTVSLQDTARDLGWSQ